MIILASKSPRRRELLEKLGLDFTVMTEDVDETMDPALPLEREILRVSEAKARAVQAGPDDLIISADTVVCVDGRRLGKPADEADAKAMLRALSGRAHTVVSGLCVLRGDRCETASVSTDRFRKGYSKPFSSMVRMNPLAAFRVFSSPPRVQSPRKVIRTVPVYSWTRKPYSSGSSPPETGSHSPDAEADAVQNIRAAASTAIPRHMFPFFISDPSGSLTCQPAGDNGYR